MVNPSSQPEPAALASLLRVPASTLKSDSIAAELEQLILTGQLATAARLPTVDELCEALGVSRSVVRDAIKTLSARGLISTRQGLGTTVTAPDDSAFAHALVLLLARSDATMDDVLNARAALESRLVPLAATHGTQEDWEELGGALEAYARAVEDGQWEHAHQRHADFHIGLLHAIHQPVLELLLRPMTELIMVSSLPPRLTAREDWQVETHGPILDALRASDAHRAERALNDHYAATAASARYQEFRSQLFRDVTDLSGRLAPSSSKPTRDARPNVTNIVDPATTEGQHV